MNKTHNTTWKPELSIAGFHKAPGTPRSTSNFNVGWRFMKGSVQGAEAIAWDDDSWPVVTLPHGMEILPLEASGGVNYQGEVWYRKRFAVPSEFEGQRVVLHFEGLMGKSKFWINGKLLTSHFGGYLPCIIDISKVVDYGEENTIAVWIDNSDDSSYPPGKPQNQLDFAYFGGIYRDVWIVTTNKIHISDPNEKDMIAGGGVFVHFEDVSDEQATVWVETNVDNGTAKDTSLTVETILLDGGHGSLARDKTTFALTAGYEKTTKQKLRVDTPHLWHVDDPYLHNLIIRITDDKGNILDAVCLRIGIRSIEFKGKDGFFLNGKPFENKLIGTNRHQDYAYVGNAVSNNAHWRDAIKLRQAGMRVIRCAHYPQDPAFMDACDALGMFVIITTPGWQFWSDNPVFEQRVYSDIRNMVRRDRNHPSAWLWEPILNETNYPNYFARRVHDITHEEYPYPGCYTVCDGGAEGQECFDVVYAHVHQGESIEDGTQENYERLLFDYAKEDRCVFTREWGDCPMDWRAQSSPSRAVKGWGERAQLLQAKHYAHPDYIFGSSYESLCATPPQHVGGTLWHGVDHQRGYHADAFWGGILDATRQPKYSFYMFKSQVDPELKIPHVETGPFVHIAHIMHTSSESDVTVYSNCEEVRLTRDGELIDCKSTRPEGTHMPHHPVVFKDAFKLKRHGMSGQTLEAEGLIGGTPVASTTRNTWDRRQTLTLDADLCGVPLQADGSDFITVVARIVDKNDEVVRLTEDTILFTLEGPAELIGGDMVHINPQKLCWGEAVILVRAGIEPGTITVRAESAYPGVCKPLSGEISLESVEFGQPLHFTDYPATGQSQSHASTEELSTAELKREVAQLSSLLNKLKLREVEKQQEDFI